MGDGFGMSHLVTSSRENLPWLLAWQVSGLESLPRLFHNS